MNIVPYTPDQYEAMREFYIQILYESKHFSPYHPSLNNGKFNAGDRLNFSVLEGSKIIAHASIYPVADKMYSVGVAVLEKHSGKGIGTELINFCCAKAKELDANKMVALIHENNWKSILLFVKCGFRIVKEDYSLRLEKEI